MAKKCKECGKLYMIPRVNFYMDNSRKDKLSIYCINCSKVINAYYEEKGKEPKEKRECLYNKCGEVFYTRIKKKKYCSGSCRSKHYQEKKGLEYVRFRQNFLKRMRRKKEPRKRNKAKWEFNEVEKLMDMKKKKSTFTEISKALNRSVSSCENKYRMICKSRGKCQ